METTEDQSPGPRTPSTMISSVRRSHGVSPQTLSPEQRLRHFLAQGVDGDLVVYFRIMFGLVALYWVAKQYSSGAIEALYIAPAHHFHYTGFAWVQPFSSTNTYIEFAVLGVAAALITAGLLYRIAAFTFAAGFTHLFLVDKCLYLNHYYLICLVSWLLVLIPANRELSLDRLLMRGRRRRSVPRWSLWILRFQLAIPYVYGGVAKLNHDWLAGEPMRAMLARRSHYPGIGVWFTEEWCVYAFSVGGLLFDLLVIPAIFYRRTRKLAMLLAVAFHLTNAWLFTIGVFPWFMILSLPLFLPPGRLRRWLARWRGSPPATSRSAGEPSHRMVSQAFVFVLSIFVVWQTLFPLRHWAIPGDVNWTEEGHTFSWHMLLRGKVPALRFLATDPKDGRTGAIDLRPYVTAFQLQRVGRDPRMIHELANLIARDLRLRFPLVEVRVLSLVSMNGRKPQLMIDPRVDLAQEPLGWTQPAWIVPLTEPLRKEPWNVPMAQWESLVSLPPTE